MGDFLSELLYFGPSFSNRLNFVGPLLL